MSYLALARRYRPHTFHDLLGQDTVSNALSQAITREKIPNGLIFHGIRGIGKTTTARIVARCLNCLGVDNTLKMPTVTPCGVCGSCLSLLGGHHMDVIEIDAASHTSVDDMRDIIDSVKYKAVQGRYKVFIIDEAHMLSKSAFNALLKTLEEPPTHVVFILATTEIKKIPDTILSRCQRFDLKPFEQEVIIRNLKTILNLEQITYEEKALSLIAKAASGSMRDALSLCDQAIVLSPSAKNLLSDTISVMLGLAQREPFFDLLNLIFTSDIPGVLCITKEWYQSGLDAILLMQDLLDILYELIVFKTQLTGEPPYGGYDFSQIPLSSCLQIWQILTKGYEGLPKAHSAFHALDVLFIQVCYLSSLVPLESLMTTTAPLMHSNPSTNSTPNSSASFAPITMDQIEMYLKKAREPILHHHLIHDVHAIEIQDGQMTICLSDSAPPQFTLKLKEALAKVTGYPSRITVQKTGGQESVAEALSKKNNASKQSVLSHPIIKTIQTAFPDSTLEWPDRT